MLALLTLFFKAYKFYSNIQTLTLNLRFNSCVIVCQINQTFSPLCPVQKEDSFDVEKAV